MSCAVGLAVLDVISNENLISSARNVGKMLHDLLLDLAVKATVYLCKIPDTKPFFSRANFPSGLVTLEAKVWFTVWKSSPIAKANRQTRPWQSISCIVSRPKKYWLAFRAGIEMSFLSHRQCVLTLKTAVGTKYGISPMT